MNKLCAVLTVALVGVAMTGCGLTDPEETSTPEITLDNISDIDVGTNREIIGEIKAGEAITAISYAILNDADMDVSNKFDIDGPSSDGSDKIEFDDGNFKIKPVSATAGDYKLEITVTAGSTVSATFPFKVKGTAAVTLTEEDGMIANITGPDTGSFDLVEGKRIPAGADDDSKDLADLSVAGEGFSGSLESKNGGMFVSATASDYANATDVSVKALAENALGSEVDVSSVGTVFAMKLGNGRGYAIVKITSYDEDAGSGSNKGEVEFSYKFTE